MGSSKQKQPQVQYQNTTNTNIPSYAKPYFEDVLARTQGEANRPYQTYDGQRTAGFTDAEKQSQQGLMGLTTPGQFGASTQMATEAGNYTPGQFDGGYDQAQFTGGNYGTGQFDGGYDATQFTGGDYGTGQFDNTYNPTQFTGGDYATGQFNGGYDPTKFTGGNYGAGQFNTNSFNDSGMASQYMSPYMQNVVDVQKQSAIRDAKQGQLAGNLGAARQGTYGGSRQLLANMERERNLGTQLGGIQATGLQSAYDAAQKQFGSEQDRRMQAQQYGELSRQFGGSQSMEAQRQAEQSRQFGSSQGMDAQRQAEQSRQFGSNRQLQAQEAQDRANQFGANFGMDAQKQREASRQFGSTRQLQAQQEQERAKQFGANFGMDAQKQREQSRQYGADQRSRAEESAARERQFGANFGMDAQRQREQSRQFGATQRTQAEQSAAAERQFGANYRMDAQRQAEQSRQYAGNQRLSAAQSLNQFGTAQQQADMQRLNAQNAVGETQRGLDQTRLDTAYGDFQRQRDYPMQQLGQYASIVQGLPMTPNSTTTQYGQAPSALAGLAGTAAAAYGGYKTFAAAGGEMRSYNNGGLVALAEGGVGSGSGGEDSVFKLRDDPKELLYSTGGDPTKLQTALQQGADPAAVAYAAMLAERIKGAAAMAPQQTTIAGLLNPQPQQPQGQPQGQQGLASIAPQGQPPMDPMQGQQPPPPTMMAANGGLMNINLPDDYYDEDSYAHGGIAYFASGQEVADQMSQYRKQQALDQTRDLFSPLRGTPLIPPLPSEEKRRRNISKIEDLNPYIKHEDLINLTDPELEAIAEGKAPPPTPSSDMLGDTDRDENSFLFSTPEENTPRAATDKPQVTPSAPQGLAQLQEVDKSTIPARTPEKVDYMAKAKELYASVPSSGMTDEEMAKDKEQRKYEALMQFGLNLAGTGSLSEAGAATMPAIIEARTSQNEAKATRKKEDRDMKVAQIQTALGLEKDDAEKVFKQQELALEKEKVALQGKLTNAQIINLGKSDNIYDLMESNPVLAEKIIGLQKTGQMTESVALKAATAIAQSNPEFFEMPPETQVNYINDLKTSLMAGSGSGNQDTPSEEGTPSKYEIKRVN